MTERKGTMARKQNTPSREEWKAALVELVKEGDYLRTVVEEVVQQILEAEMDETLGAERGSGQLQYFHLSLLRPCTSRRSP